MSIVGGAFIVGGSINIASADNGGLGLGFLLLNHRGHGIGAQAQRRLTAHLFATTPLARVEAATDAANIAEQRALEKAGFTREGTLRRAQFRAGTWHDVILFSRLRDE